MGKGEAKGFRAKAKRAGIELARGKAHTKNKQIAETYVFAHLPGF